MLRTGTLANARRLLGEGSTPAQREALAREVIGNFYDFVCDVGRSATMNRQQLQGRIEAVQGLDRYDAARRERQGAIVVTAHMGSFEIGVAGLMEYERQVHVLFRRDERGLFEQTRSALRRRLGVTEAYVEDGLPVWMRLREALERNEVVLIQGDRVLPGQKGKRVPFLGGTMLLPTGPVKLAMASGAPLIPVFTVRTSHDTVRLFIEEAIRVPPGTAEEGLRQLVTAIEHYVRQYPGQWLMVHPAWCEDVESSEFGSRAEA